MVAYKVLIKTSRSRWYDTPKMLVADDLEDAKRRAWDMRTDDTDLIILFDSVTGDPFSYREKLPDGTFSDWKKV